MLYFTFTSYISVAGELVVEFGGTWLGECFSKKTSLLRSVLFQIHGVSGHVGTTIVPSGPVGEGARGRGHHGLRSFSPRPMRSTSAYCTVQATKFEQRVWWAGRLFSGEPESKFQKDFWSSLKETTKEYTSWKVWILYVNLLVPLMQFVNLFFKCRMVWKGSSFRTFLWDKLGTNSTWNTARRQLDVNFW